MESPSLPSPAASMCSTGCIGRLISLASYKLRSPTSSEFALFLHFKFLVSVIIIFTLSLYTTKLFQKYFYSIFNIFTIRFSIFAKNMSFQLKVNTELFRDKSVKDRDLGPVLIDSPALKT